MALYVNKSSQKIYIMNISGVTHEVLKPPSNSSSKMFKWKVSGLGGGGGDKSGSKKNKNNNNNEASKLNNADEKEKEEKQKNK